MAQGEKGSTLIELAVSLGLGGMVIAALMLSFSAVSRAEAESSRLAAVQRDMAAALQRTSDLIDLAGLCLQPGETALQASQTALLVYWRDVGPNSFTCPAGAPSWSVVRLVYLNAGHARLEETFADGAANPPAVSPRYLTSEATRVTGVEFTHPPACPGCVRVCLTARPNASGGREVGDWKACTTVRPRNGAAP